MHNTTQHNKNKVSCCTWLKYMVVPTFVFLFSFTAIADTINIVDDIQTYASLTGDTVNMSGVSELHVTSATTPISACTINLNSEDSFFFLENIEPSAVNTSAYLSQIKVDGASAVLGTNIRIVQYVNGTVVIPHASSYQPLTVYSGFDYTGTSMSLGQSKNDSLGALNNDISSFKLKRGYMATFSGTESSRTYVAQDKDINIIVMPEELNDSVYCVSVFPWRWVGKKGASDDYPLDLDPDWWYDWGSGVYSTQDAEYVAMRHHDGWDSLIRDWWGQSVDHLLGFNEPDKLDQANLTVSQAVSLWSGLLATGLRLGAPAVTDSSGTDVGVDWLYNFIDQADAAGLRVDYIPVHYYRCYSNNDYPQGAADQLYYYLRDIHNRTGRPIWVTEWNNGASWTTCDDPTYEQNRDVVEAMMNRMDNAPWVERYSIYSKVEYTRQTHYDEGGLTPMGVMYRDHVSPAAYLQTPAKGGFGCAYYEFENDAVDSLYSLNDGVVHGTEGYTTGHSGQAIDLDGSNDYVMLPENLADCDDFTFAAWVYWDGGGSWQRIFDFGANTERYMFLSPNCSGSNLRFAIKNGGSEQQINTSTLATGTWVHVAVTLSGNTGKLFVNGSQVASNTSMTINPSGLQAFSNYLGRSHFVQDTLFNGRLDDVRIANYALANTQITALYNGTVGNIPPVFLDDPITKPNILSGNAYSGTLFYDAGDADADDVLTFSKISGPDWLTIDADGTLSGVPGVTDAGNNTFTVRVTDSQSAYDDATLSIYVETDPTLAWWTFEEGTAGAEVPGTSDWTTYQVGTPDMSGNGNHLCDYWDGPGNSSITYSSNVPTVTGVTNTLSGLSEGGSYPSMFTWSDQSGPVGIDLETVVMSEWTIEAFIYPTEIAGQNRGIVGRDGKRSSTDVASPLYFNIQSGGTLRCTYYDQAATVHDAQSTVTLTTNNWYYVAATCDGTNLKLWLADLTTGETTATQVASTDVSGSSDPDFGPWLDGGRGNWSVFRGYWSSGDVDRFMGNIDEVRISAAALDVNSEGLLFLGNVAPSFTTDPISNAGGIELTDYAGNSLAIYADDPESGPLTFSKDSGPDWLMVASDGTLSGVPADSISGTDTFTVRVTDNGGLYDTATMTIDVANVYSGVLGVEDLLGLAAQWLMTDCTDTPACDGADLSGDTGVDMEDVRLMAHNWLIDEAMQLSLQFNETSGDTANDKSIYLRDGLLVNGPVWSSGTIGGAIDFDGTDDYVDVTGYPGILGNTSRTCCAWIKTAVGGDILGWGNNLDAGSKWRFQVTATGLLSIQLQGGKLNSDTGGLLDDAWHHVAVVVPETASPATVDDMLLYIDGSPVSTTATTPGTVINTSGDGQVKIGVFEYNGAGLYYFDGLIDDVRVYNTALTESEINEIANP